MPAFVFVTILVDIYSVLLYLCMVILVGLEGVEPSLHRLKGEYARPLNITSPRCMVDSLGYDPRACRLRGECSIHLSYESINLFRSRLCFRFRMFLSPRLRLLYHTTFVKYFLLE